MNKILLSILVLSFYLISCNDESQQLKERELALKEKELKLKEREIEENKKTYEKQENKNNQDNLQKTIPASPVNTKMRWVSKNFYGNGHDEYLFLVEVPNTNDFPHYVYYSTSQNRYIELINTGRPANSKNSDYPNASDIQGVEFPNSNNAGYVIYRFRNGSLISVSNNNPPQTFQQY